jgi:hypothetical protein
MIGLPGAVTLRRPVVAYLVAIAACLVVPVSALAQDHIPDADWRRPDHSTVAPHDPLFTVEIRFGPYWPDVDGEFGTDKGPYFQTFGSKPNFYFGLELDFTPLRIPYVGAFGPGFGWGWTQAKAPATIASTGQPSAGETTSLTIMPMHLSAVLRADELMRRTGVPLVPYVKVGPAIGVWTASNSLGTSVVGPGCTQANPDAAGCVEGKGATWGADFALGGALSLNFLDPTAASLLEHGSDVAHVYLFGEWMDAILTGFGSKKEMHVGSSTVVVGLSADF